jgi:hypothetical protein
MDNKNKSLYLSEYKKEYSCFSDEEKRRFDYQIELLRIKSPHLEEVDLWQSVLIGKHLVDSIPSYTTAEIVKMASKQRARHESTVRLHETIAVDVAVLVKLCGFKRDSAALILSYAHWSDYTPLTIKDFYKRHLPNEYKRRDYEGLSRLIDENKGGLSVFYNFLASRLERLPQLYKKLPEQDAKRLELWLESLKGSVV